jgi:hypothetical protein
VAVAGPVSKSALVSARRQQALSLVASEAGGCSLRRLCDVTVASANSASADSAHIHSLSEAWPAMSAAGAARDGGGSDDSMSEANPLYSHPYYSPVKVCISSECCNSCAGRADIAEACPTCD